MANDENNEDEDEDLDEDLEVTDEDEEADDGEHVDHEDSLGTRVAVGDIVAIAHKHYLEYGVIKKTREDTSTVSIAVLADYGWGDNDNNYRVGSCVCHYLNRLLVFTEGMQHYFPDTEKMKRLQFIRSLVLENKKLPKELP